MARSRGVVSRAKRRSPSKRTRRQWLSNDFARRAGGFALLVLAVLTSISLATGDGGFAQVWNSFLRATFGWAAFLIPILLAAFGLALVWPYVQQGYRFQAREAAGWLLLFASFATIFHLLSGAPSASFGGGGSFGQGLAAALVTLMGPTGGLVAAIAALALGVLLAFGLGPRALWGVLLLVFVVVVWLAKLAFIVVRTLVPFAWRAIGRIAHRLVREREPEPHFRINRPEVDQSVVEQPKQSNKARAVGKTQQELPRNGDGAPVEAAETTFPDPIKVSQMANGPRQWQLPPIELLEPGGEGALSEADIRQKVERIEETLREFGISASVVEVNPGPVVTQFGLDPGFRERRDRSGNVIRRDRVKVSEITALRDDLALGLAARTVRIEAPVPGRAVIGLEIPNSTAVVVQLRKVIETTAFQRVRTKSKLAIALGQDVSGGAVAADLAKMPHLLIAGATGSGKSVCMNAIITCLLLNTTPDELRLVMIDPKRVELTSFRKVPHLLRSVVVDAEHAVSVLRWIMHEMETRLKRFEAQNVRNIDGYNKAMTGRDGKPAMPYIVLLIDELADLMMTAPDEVERSVCRLAQLARATGIHLVIATQRPSVDVVTGLIKANLPTRISFAVASQIDSRTILDAVGAEQLLGSGDMLYMPSDAAKPRRLQGVYLSDDEVKRIVDHWRRQGPPQYVGELEQAAAWSKDEVVEDPIYERALDVTRQYTRVSASLLQRRLGVGYNRAAKLMDMLEGRGVVAPAEGAKPREVLQQIEDGIGEAMSVKDADPA